MKISTSSYLAEYLGTFFFILVILSSGGNPLIIGGALVLTIFIIASISGGHVNPAVSIAMYLQGSMRPADLFSYIFAQFLGGMSAFYAYKLTH